MSSNIIQTLVTQLTADGAQMREEFNRTMRDTQSWGSRTLSIAKKVGVGIAAAGAGAALGLGAMVKASIDSADELSKLSQIVGVDIGALSKLKYAADLSDVSLEALGGGLKKFNKNIVAAAEGTGAQADAFKALGIDINNADGSLKNTGQLFGEVTEGISRLEDGTTKTALAMEFFGKSGADLIPMLNGGRQGLKDAGDEAQRFGLVVSQEAGKAAEEFNDNLNRLGQSAKGVANLIAEEVTPTLAELTATMQDPATQEGLASIASGIISIGAASIQALADVGNFTKWLGEEFATRATGIALDDIPRLEGLLVDLEAVKGMGFAERILKAANYTDENKLDAAIEVTKKQIAAANDLRAALSPSSVKTDSKPAVDQWSADAMAADDTDKIQRNLATQKEREASLKSLQEEQKKLNELVMSETAAMMEKLALGTDATELQKIQYRELNGDLQNATLAQKVKLEGLAAEIDMQKQLADLADWAKDQWKEKAELEELLMTDVERTNKLWDDRINKIKTLGYDEAKANEMIAKAEAGRKEDLDEKGKKGVDDLSEYSRQAAREMQGAFADFLFDPFEDGLDGLLKSFGQTIQRMAAEWAAAQIFDSMGDWGKANSGSGGFLGGLASIAGEIFGGMFAEGGRPPLGKISVVGDGGEPELFVPDTAGTIIPFSKLGGGGGSSISIGHMSFPGVTNAREAEMAAGAAARKMLGIMSNAQRYS